MKVLGKQTATWFLATALCAVPMWAQNAGAPQDAPPQSDAGGPPPDGGPHRGGPEHRVEMLQKRLSLSTDQTAQVKSLFATERTQMEALRGNTSLSQDDRRSQMMALHKDTDGKLRALLTPDQVTKYDAMQAQMREHRHDGGGPPPPPQ